MVPGCWAWVEDWSAGSDVLDWSAGSGVLDWSAGSDVLDWSNVDKSALPPGPAEEEEAAGAPP